MWDLAIYIHICRCSRDWNATCWYDMFYFRRESYRVIGYRDIAPQYKAHETWWLRGHRRFGMWSTTTMMMLSKPIDKTLKMNMMLNSQQTKPPIWWWVSNMIDIRLGLSDRIMRINMMINGAPYDKAIWQSSGAAMDEDLPCHQMITPCVVSRHS